MLIQAPPSIPIHALGIQRSPETRFREETQATDPLAARSDQPVSIAKSPRSAPAPSRTQQDAQEKCWYESLRPSRPATRDPSAPLFRHTQKAESRQSALCPG